GGELGGDPALEVVVVGHADVLPEPAARVGLVGADVQEFRALLHREAPLAARGGEEERALAAGVVHDQDRRGVARGGGGGEREQGGGRPGGRGGRAGGRRGGGAGRGRGGGGGRGAPLGVCRARRPARVVRGRQ